MVEYAILMQFFLVRNRSRPSTVDKVELNCYGVVIIGGVVIVTGLIVIVVGS